VVIAEKIAIDTIKGERNTKERGSWHPSLILAHPRNSGKTSIILEIW